MPTFKAVWSDSANQVYRLRGGRSKHYITRRSAFIDNIHLIATFKIKHTLYKAMPAPEHSKQGSQSFLLILALKKYAVHNAITSINNSSMQSEIWCSGAGTIFGKEGQDRERQNQQREIKVFAGIGAFFVRKQVFSKKEVLAGFGAFACPKNGSGYRSLPPTSRAYNLVLQVQNCFFPEHFCNYLE